MKVREVSGTEPYELSPHGHAFINPYGGCTMGCPFCFWLSRDGWENKMEIRMDTPSLLEEALKTWPKGEWIYLGSICDPFNEWESKYRLSEQCLQVIDKYQIPLLITTSAVSPALAEEAEILKRMKAPVVIVTELARIPEAERLKKEGIHRGIEAANALKKMGLTVWTTMAPVCPGILELEPVLEKLDQEIPVYIDSLQCGKNSVQEKRVMEWIRNDYPQLESLYEKIVLEKDLTYFDVLLEQYENDPRIKTFPYELDTIVKSR